MGPALCTKFMLTTRPRNGAPGVRPTCSLRSAIMAGLEGIAYGRSRLFTGHACQKAHTGIVTKSTSMTKIDARSDRAQRKAGVDTVFKRSSTRVGRRAIPQTAKITYAGHIRNSK